MAKTLMPDEIENTTEEPTQGLNLVDQPSPY